MIKKLSISRIINELLIIINICQILTIFIMFLKNEMFSLIILTEPIYYYLLLFSIITIIIIIIFECFRKKNIIFQRKKQFIIYNSFIIVTIDIILLSIFISYLFVEFQLLNKNLILLFNKYNIILIVEKILNLIILVFNIFIFQLYKYYTEENNIDFDNESIKTDPTYEEESQFKEINNNDSNKILFQKYIIDKLSILSEDAYTQTI